MAATGTRFGGLQRASGCGRISCSMCTLVALILRSGAKGDRDKWRSGRCFVEGVMNVDAAGQTCRRGLSSVAGAGSGFGSGSGSGRAWTCCAALLRAVYPPQLAHLAAMRMSADVLVRAHCSAFRAAPPALAAGARGSTGFDTQPYHTRTLFL
jgi:hypothetical protein